MNSTAPKVSVIIPCYNLGEYLEEAVDSVLASTFGDYEILVVNDGSSEKQTLAALERLSHEKVRVYHTENQGLPRTRNCGIDLARGEYITCLDSDDLFAPSFLEKCAETLDADQKEKLGFVTTWVERFGEVNAPWETADYDPIRLCTENVIHVASMFRKSCWERVGGYKTNLKGYQDWDFWLSIVAMGYRWACVHEYLFKYRTRKNSMVTQSDQKRAGLCRVMRSNNLDLFRANVVEICEEYDRRHLQMVEKEEALHLYIQKLEMEVLGAKSEIDSLNETINRLRERTLWDYLRKTNSH